jgi:hypothetical protein
MKVLMKVIIPVMMKAMIKTMNKVPIKVSIMLSIMLFFLICWATEGVAQHLEAGLGVGFKKISSGVIDLDSLAIEITNPSDERFLIPAASIIFTPGKRWQVQAGIQHQSGGISIRGYNVNADTCLLCPVKKGALVSFREFLFSTSVSYQFWQKKDWKIFAGVGLVYALRYNVESSLKADLNNIGSGVNYILRNAASLGETNYLNSQLQTSLSWRRWALSYQFLTSVSTSVAGRIKTPAGELPVNINQTQHILMVRYRWLSF